MSDFGIYVHWPYCSAKCPYCDFNSHVRAAYDETRWCDAIIRELHWVRQAQDRFAPDVSSIFFGGGTPSLTSGKSIAAILDAIAKLWPVASDVEVTLEANPASAEAERFRDYRAAGVNRISLGVQALNDADLKFLGRLHDVAEAKAALKMAMTAFDRVSLDLIYARPKQTPEAWRRELTEALAFGTEHLSLYQLTIEPETPFAILEKTGSLVVPDEDRAASLFELTQELTEAAGRPAYEISNHAKPGAECRHNLIYWRYGDYVGVGPGAHGRITLPDGRKATFAERLPERWMEKVAREGCGYGEIRSIDEREAGREHLLMNLRLREGIDTQTYAARWHTQLDGKKIAELRSHDLVDFDGINLSATPKGRLVLNAILAELAA
jgi:putative oxygen-independent coproporphyrinogen III oxidase